LRPIVLVSKTSCLIHPDLKKKAVIGRNKGVSSKIYRLRLDRALTVVKADSLTGSIERRQIDTEVENLLNLRHPMIAPLIGCVFPVESSGRWEFRTVRLYATDGSLTDVLSDLPAWWTPKVKAKRL
jgi:hypothetical protein